MGKTRQRKSADEPRACFVVVSWEGCMFPDLCNQAHVIVDCEVHGMLARCKEEDTGRFIMRGHLDMPSWPVPLEPLTQECLDRILASKVQPDHLYVPSRYGEGRS
jgi:hypothetical protein